MAIVEIEDSRRLTGPSLVGDGPGAVIDCSIEQDAGDDFLSAWRARAREVLDAVGWHEELLAERLYAGGATLFLSAPVDALYAATEVNEWAWAAAAADVGAGPVVQSLEEVLPRLRQQIEEERNPPLLALQGAAAAHGVSFLTDDDHASVGTGAGSRTWPVHALPNEDDVPWDEIFDVPRVLVTGTNGKTTTVRMLAAIVEAAGHTAGFTCTDGIYVAGEVLEAGDWSGPGGARAVLRDRRVQYAILETARGGMLRRGLAVDRADAALVTNVAADHLGEWGVLTVDDVAAAKLVVAKAVRHGAPLVVNADDPHLSRAARGLGRSLTWIAVEEVDRVLSGAGSEHRSAVEDGGENAVGAGWALDAGWLVRVHGRVPERVVEARAIPATLGGAASYNVSNALGAAALAGAWGLSYDAIRSGLEGFDASPEKSPGRGNLFDVGGVRVLVDFVHNAHGFLAIAKAVEGLTSQRVGLMIGHAGDRDDESIRELARAAWLLNPARVAIKEMPAYLRGREPGEVPSIIGAELSALGAPEEALSTHVGEVSAARALLQWARPGDLVLLSTQADRGGVLEVLDQVGASEWNPRGA